MSGKAVRNTKIIKDNRRTIKLSVVIPAATEGNRMRSFGPRSLIQVNNNTLIEYQINTIRDIFPHSDIIVVCGFEANKLMNRVPRGTICIENERYSETNVLRSVGMGLRAAIHEHVLIVYGDVVFNPSSLDFPVGQSCIVYDKRPEISASEVGCTVSENKLENMFYGLSNRWTSLSYFTGKELSMLKAVAFDKQKEKLYTWEVINDIIERGGSFGAYSPKGTKHIDIDSVKDMEKISEVLK